MSEDNLTFKIRPAARLVHTIGKDLIGDSYAALVELVKNSYDADAKSVEVIFNFLTIDGEDALKISISDDGHGMSFDTVINKWLVPATNDKLKRKSSPGGRTFQGRKGIGRFAASILGQEMTISTTDNAGENSTAVIDWRIFNSDDFLDNIELLVERKKVNKAAGTYIEIIAKDEEVTEKIDGKEIRIIDPKLSYWSRTNIENLENELKKLISPLQDFERINFKINLSFINSPYEELNQKDFKIEPYPIIKLYDYRIYGRVSNEGFAELIYENNIEEIGQKQEINKKYKLEKYGRYCGNIEIDFRVFDREPEAIENLINKGLIDPVTQKYAGKNEARRLLNEVYGVNVYRNNFRVRPYGNGGIDWLDLDKDRVQNFTLRVSNNQVVGFVTIESEENSNLEEKSARDGLKENEYYLGLKEICKKVLGELEAKRLTYREKTLKSRKGRSSIQNDVNELFNFDTLESAVKNKLSIFKVKDDTISEITKLIKQEEERKTVLLENIQKTIAVYQGQATLGKIVSFILHEGRKSIHFFKNESPVLRRYLSHYKATKDEDSYEDLISGLDGFIKHSGLIADLFKRVNPLASQSRGKKIDFKILDCIIDVVQIFNQSLKSSNIELKYHCDSNLLLYGWNNDLYIALANLVENSIYWLNSVDLEDKLISIEVRKGDDFILIDYQDNGPGLSKEEIETEIIFEPGYSKKIDGTGLGLAIAGEAIERLNGKLIAHESTTGAYFQIELINK